MNISLPLPLRRKLEEKVNRLGVYGSTSEFVRELIRRDLQRDAVEHVDQLLLEAVNNGKIEPMTPEWRKARRTTLAKNLKAAAARKKSRP